MDQARTHTNTPPAETIALKSEPTAGRVSQADAGSSSPGSGGPNTMATAASSPEDNAEGEEARSAGPGLKQPDPRQQLTDYMQDMRALGSQGYITPSQQQGVADEGPARRLERERGGPADSSFNTTMTHNNTTIFKPFDTQTGQFLSTPASAASALARGDSAATAVSASSASAASSQEHRSRNDQRPSAGRLRRMKFRSHSVPTILHSSCRRLNASSLTASVSTSSATQLRDAQAPPQLEPAYANSAVSSTSTVSSGSMPPASQFAGIKKKKHGGKGNQGSLRNAILMSHRLPPASGQDLSIDDRIRHIKMQSDPMPLPPINLQCLREIDLSEIVKNPQLRHDIVFDPLLQFRPNLDGERGVKKRQIADKYWAEVENEIIVYNQRPEVFDYSRTRLVPLFDTLKDVLVTIVPQKEISTVENVLDTELLIQELLKGSLIMTNLSDWLAQLFKHHCAPMRDPWVDGMQCKFREAQEEKSVIKLVEALKLVFQILEAMKLDIANHQIRILRPALLSNAVEFERQYFRSLMNSQRVNLKSSLKWFKDKYDESVRDGSLKSDQLTKIPDIYRLCIRNIISLLSCRKMVREYPTSLAFDHARLILLRADIRQAVCLLVCKLLFKQLVVNDTTADRATKEYVVAKYNNKRLKEEIVSIITDEHGNCRWTKNTMSIAIHLCKTIDELKQEFETLKLQNTRQLGATRTFAAAHQASITNPKTTSTPISKTLTQLDSKNIDFAKSWLSKQTQPLSEVYGVLENRVFNSLEESIFRRSNCTKDGVVKQDFINLCNSNSQGTTSSGMSGVNTNHSVAGASCSPSSSVFSTPSRNHHLSAPAAAHGGAHPSGFPENDSAGSMASLDMEEFESLYRHLYAVVNFHWSVFGCHYVEALGDNVERI